MTEKRPSYNAGSPIYENLPPGVSSKPCPRCQTLLNWSDLHPPKVVFDGLTGFVSHIEMDRWCVCGYTETGFVNVDKDPVWTEVVENELSVEQEMKERARLAAQWLLAGLTSYKVDPIDWQQAGLQAAVVVEGVRVGTLLDVYNRFRTEDNFYQWLRSKLEE